MKKLIAPLMSLALTGPLFTACYVADTELAPAGAGENVSMTVGWTLNGTLTEKNQPYAFVTYIDEASNFQLKEGRQYVDIYSNSSKNYDLSIEIKSTTPPSLATSIVQGKGHWNLLVSETDVKAQNPDSNMGVELGQYKMRHDPIVIPGISRQASIGVRGDDTIVVLGRKTLEKSGVARTDSSPGLVLITEKPVRGERDSYRDRYDLVLQTVSTRELGLVSSINPLLALDPSSTAYLASWKNSESDDVSALFVNAAGKEKALTHIQPGSPKAAWTDGKSFRIASLDNQGMSYLFDGTNLVDGPKVSGALCNAFDFGDDGTLSVLTVSDAAVTLTQVAPDAAPTSIRISGAVNSHDEVSRNALCALSHTGARTNVAWQGVQSDMGEGIAPSPGTLYSGIENGRIVDFYRFNSGPAQKVKFKIALPDEGVGRVTVTYTMPEYTTTSTKTCYHSRYPNAGYSSDFPLCENNEFETKAGSAVSLSAEAYTDGSSFRGWSGGSQFGIGFPLCQGNSPTCKFTIHQSTTIGAEFKAPPLSIGVVGSTGPGGAVTSTPSGISCITNGGSTYNPVYGLCSKGFAVGTQLVLTAVPQEYTAFVGWGGAPGCNDASLSCTVTITDEPLKITPQFAHITKTVTIVKTGTGTGAVTTDANQYYTATTCGTECTLQVRKNYSRNLVASAAPGSQFTGWTNCPYISPYSDGRTCQVSYSESNTAPAQLTVTANFNTIP